MVAGSEDSGKFFNQSGFLHADHVYGRNFLGYKFTLYQRISISAVQNVIHIFPILIIYMYTSAHTIPKDLNFRNSP
jgi:hypothetical protein